MDKTTQIDQKLEEIVKKIREEDDKILQSIKEGLKKHEEDVKQKLSGYIDITKKGLESIKKEMEKLEEKIMNYIKVGGEFQKLERQLRAYYHKINYDYINRKKYIEYDRRLSREQDTYVKNKLSDINLYFHTYEKKIWDVKKELMFLTGILGYRYRAESVIDELSVYKENKTLFLSHIPDFVNRLKQFQNFGNKIRRHTPPMKYLIEITTSIESAKSIVNKNKEHLDKLLPHNLEHIHVIKTQDINGLIRDISDLRSSISTSIKHLNNTKLLIDYSNAFEAKKTVFEGIRFDEPLLRVIGKLIRPMRQFRKGYKELIWSIFKSSYDLFSKFERDENKTSDHRKNRREYLPTTMPLGRKPLKEITGQIKKLRAMQFFSPGLNGYSIGSLHLIQGPEGSDIEGLLGELEELNETLIGSWYVGYNIGKIRESYEGNKGQINGTDSSNVNSIQGHVESIKKIPKEISELKSKVRYYVVHLNIAKSVNENLVEAKWKGR